MFLWLVQSQPIDSLLSDYHSVLSYLKTNLPHLLSVKNYEDFFDERVMEQVRYGLLQLNDRTGIDIGGGTSTITFHSNVSGISGIAFSPSVTDSPTSLSQYTYTLWHQSRPKFVLKLIPEPIDKLLKSLNRELLTTGISINDPKNDNEWQ